MFSCTTLQPGRSLTALLVCAIIGLGIAPAQASASGPRGAATVHVSDQRHPAPRVLIRRDFRTATPTHWCRRHRPRCLRVLTARYVRAFRHHRLGHTSWTPRAVRRIRPAYIASYRQVCRAVARSGLRPDQSRRYACPTGAAATAPRLRSAAGAWTAYRQGADCSLQWIPWAGQPGYHMVCAPRPPDHGVTVGSDGKRLVACEAAAFGSAAVVGSFSTLAGAAVTFGSVSTGCTIQWAFAHYLNW